MMRVLRQVQPATLIAAAALFVALGGTAYSAATINGDQINVRSIPGNRLEFKALTRAEINLQKLGTVLSSRHASTASVASKALSVVAPRWHALSLENGWVGGPFGTGAPAVANYNGLIYLRGAMGTTGTTPVAFVLPAADRPPQDVFVPVDLCNATNGRLQIQSTGAVTVQAEGGNFSNAQCFTSLDGVVFAP